jgi:hypothetical protein
MRRARLVVEWARRLPARPAARPFKLAENVMSFASVKSVTVPPAAVSAPVPPSLMTLERQT